MNKVLKTTTQYLTKNSPTILAILAAGGVVATAVLAAQETPKVLTLLRMAEEEDPDAPLTKTQVFLIATPVYIPAITMAVVTIGCIFGSNAISLKRNTALTSAYSLLNNSYREYVGKVKEIFGPDADGQILDALAKDKYDELGLVSSNDNRLWFYEPFSGEFFQLTEAEVIDAEYQINRSLALNGSVSLNDFREHLGLDRTIAGDEVGWSLYMGEIFYNYIWIDFEHELVMEDDRDYYVIAMPYLPTADYLN